jgi:lipoprotein-anchoring transpeptidase ErfK/SrfK
VNACRRAAALSAAIVLFLAVFPARADTPQPGGGTADNNLAWQEALDQLGLSPGLVDGRIGAKTRLATREFQRVRGLPETGELDPATADALHVDPSAALTTYAIRPADLSDVAPLPTDWQEKSRLDRLRYPSLAELVAEKFHTSRSCLARLNPGLSLSALKVGDTLAVPNVAADAPAPHADRIDINLSEKVIRASAGGKLIALFHCSIAKDKAKLPSGEARVAVISTNPNYTFDPAKWPDVRGIDHKLLIPPGPRNPVGLCWVGLSLPGYGIHGTPTPELIGKTGSHGCFRLANWDAVRLGRLVSVGTPVHFSTGPSLAATAADLPVVAAAR